MDHQQKDASCSSQQCPLSETEFATKLQALVRGYLFRKDYFIEYEFKSASSKEFPQRVYVHVNDLRRFPSCVSAMTMNDFSSERSMFTYYEEEEEEEKHPGFAGNEQEEHGPPIRCPRRMASKESNSSFLVSSFRLLTLDEDEEHPRFENTVPEETRTPVKRPTRMLSKEVVESEKISDESSLLFSPTTVNAVLSFSSPKGKKLSMLSFSPLPFARGQKVLARRQEARKSAPAKVMQDRPVCVPQRQISVDAGSIVSSASRSSE
jgi:hypothetical protein